MRDLFYFILLYDRLTFYARIMPPNTPHAVYTPEHSICWGGHFYATGTMERTFWGIVHGFIAGGLITNAEHSVSRSLLQRTLCYYYQGMVLKKIPDTGVYYSIYMWFDEAVTDSEPC